MNYLFTHYINILFMVVGAITLAITFIFILQSLILALTCTTYSLITLEKLHNSSIQYARKVFVVPWVIVWKLIVMGIQMIVCILYLIVLYLVKYGTRVLPVNPSTLWKIQQYGTPLFMEQAPWMVKWVRNIYGSYLNWLYPKNYELFSTLYSLIFIFSYLCRWIGYFMYLTYYYIVYLVRRCLLFLCTPYIVEILFFSVYYIYRRVSYYINLTVYKISWGIYTVIRVQSYYLLPNLALYYLRRFLNRNWQEWYFAENTQGDGQTPEFIYMDNPSPYIIKLFKEGRPCELEESNGGLGYVLVTMQMAVLHLWAILIILPVYSCYKLFEWISKFFIHVNYNFIPYYYTCVRAIYGIWEWLFTYETKTGCSYYITKGIHTLIKGWVLFYKLLPVQITAVLHMILTGLFYIVYMCIWFIYHIPSYTVISMSKITVLLIKHRVFLLLLCLCYWGNYAYISQIIHIICDTISNLYIDMVKYVPHLAVHLASIPSSFSSYDLIAHVSPQLSVGGGSYPTVNESIALMERIPANPYVLGYGRYYQLYDLSYIHPRMKYWYSPVVYRWWDDVYYYYTDHIYAWVNLDPRARWMHLAVKLNTSVWAPYQVTKAWHSFSEWGSNWIPILTVEGSAWRSNLFVTTPAQEQALSELQEPWNRVIHWPYGITRLNVGGQVDYHIGGRYLTGAFSDYDAYSYVDIYRDGSAKRYELWLIKQLQKAMVENNLKIGWPFFSELTTSPALSRVDLLNPQGVQLQVVTYNSNYPHLNYKWYTQLVMWKWGFMDNIPDILRKRDKYTWMSHLHTLTGSWELYKVQLYSKWLRPFHGTLFSIQDWFARGFINIVWEVVNSKSMFWWQYSHYNFTLKLCIIISFINHMFIIYPYMWVNFLWNVINGYYATFDMLYNWGTIVIYWINNKIIFIMLQLQFYSYNYINMGNLLHPIINLNQIFTTIQKIQVYLCLDILFKSIYYNLACYIWYIHIVVIGYIHLIGTSVDTALYFFNNKEDSIGYYITASTNFNHALIARYLDILNSRQHLQNVLDWIYIQDKVLAVTQVVMHDLVETESGEWEYTTVILDVNSEQLNPLVSLDNTYMEEKKEILLLQGPEEVAQSTNTWLQDVISVLCNHKGYTLWASYMCKEITNVLQFMYYMCTQLVHYGEKVVPEIVLGWTPRYSITNIFYLPVIIFTKLQYWIDSWCIELQLPRRMQKYRLIYEYKRVGGHLKGHSQDLTYLRISPVRRSLLFSSYKWKPHNFMDYLQYVNSVQYTDPWWGGVTPYNGVKVAVGSEVIQAQYSFPTTVMFNYPSNYIIRPLALSTIIMYYVTLFTLLFCSNTLSTLITCKQSIATCNRQYAWDKFRNQFGPQYEWMYIPANKSQYIRKYMNLTSKAEYKHLLLAYTLINNQVVTNNHLVQPLLGELQQHSTSIDTSYISTSVYNLMSDNKYALLCNNLLLPTDEFIKGVAFGYSKDKWIPRVSGKEEEEDYVEWDQAFTYNEEYAKLHVQSFNKLYNIMFSYENVYGLLPGWVWHKDPYNLRIFERYIAEDLTSTTSYVYEERVEDTPYIPWGALAWGCIVPILLFTKPLVFMGKWWHHTNRQAHMLTQQFNFYMEEVIHHLGIMDYMALFTPREMVDFKIGGYAHATKPDMKRVYLLAYDSVYGENFYTNYTGDDPTWLSEGKLLATSIYGTFNSSIEELRLTHLFNLAVVWIIIIYLFKRARVQPKPHFTPVSNVKYKQISHYIWVKKQGQRFFTWFWR